MDVAAFLTKLNINPLHFKYFEGAFLYASKYSRNSNVVLIKIGTRDILPVDVYDEVIEKSQEYFNCPVKLKIVAEKPNAETTSLREYISHYANEKGLKELESVIPLVDGNKIYLKIAEKYVPDLENYLNMCGFTQTITLDELVKEPDFNVLTPVSSGSANYVRESNNYQNRRVSKPKMINKADYLRLLIRDLYNLKSETEKVWFVGQIFTVEYRQIKNKKELQKVYVTDHDDAITFTRFEGNSLSKEEMHELKEGTMIAVYGTVSYNNYDRCKTVNPDLVEILDQDDPWKRYDNWEGEKHIDLHVHTNKSEMDGVSECTELINQAFEFGQKAIAICDTSVVQAYPNAQGALLAIDKKHPDNDFKVIYGIEMKVVDDKLRIVHNPSDQKVENSEFAVIDLETTGLSTKYDYIIEFGGIIVRNNTVIESEKKQIFIKPPVPIPPFIQQKTNITNEMVADAKSFEEAVDEILDFIGDRVIVAHNADFDFNFLNEKLIQIGREPLKNICLDTLNLSKELVKSRKYYRLGLIAKNYGVSYDDEVAHRGDYDAQVLANILVRMLPTIPGYHTITFNDLQEKQDIDVFKKARAYSVTLLAKNMAGIKNIYELVTLSHTKYLNYFAKENAKKADSDVVAEPRIIRAEIEKRRENIFVGSSNLYSELFEIAMDRSDADIEECMKFYDYIEIQPLDNYKSYIEEGSSVDKKRIEDVVNNIIRIADKLGKPVIANNDVYYTNPSDKIAREIYIMSKRIGGGRHPLYPLNKEKRINFESPDQHLMTTEEIMKAFEFTGERAHEFVIDNPLKIADQIEKLYPIPLELRTPSIEGCEDLLSQEIYNNACALYGNPLPDIVRERIEKELNSVITNGFSVQYYIAHLLVKQANEDGYIVGSRGSVGSSFIATMANITEVNPLVPHYLCPNCHHSEFFMNNEYANGFDLPVKKCPVCGTEMMRNGHSIPFETFLGFNGDKVPDIDLNFSPDYQGKAQQQIRELFGEQYSYRAGTVSTTKNKQAYGYVHSYCEETNKLDNEGKPAYSSAYQAYLAHLCEGVKRTSGQHPGGIVVVPKEYEVHDFTPIQYPANNPFADWLTTHFAFSDLHDNLLKLDILGHVDPTAIRLLRIYTGVDPKDIPMNDPEALSLFSSIDALHINDPKGYYHELNGAAGLPEFGTHNNRNILNKTKPTSFAELVSLSGLTHGTDVWSNNAETLIEEQGLTLKDVIGCRDDIMTYLISKGMPAKESFDIMEKVRKGKGLTPQWIDDMRAHDVPEWYIGSCQKIQYMFPKAHAVAYVMNAMRIAWCKVHHPAEYYAIFFSCRCDAYEIETMLKGEDAIHERLEQIRYKMEHDSRNVTDKETWLETTLEVSLEMYLRGYHFSNISLRKSEAVNFIVDPDDPKGVIPSFSSIDGLGENVGESIVEARKERYFFSKEDLQKRTLVNNTQLAFMNRLGILEDMSDEDQVSLF